MGYCSIPENNDSEALIHSAKQNIHLWEQSTYKHYNQYLIGMASRQLEEAAHTINHKPKVEESPPPAPKCYLMWKLKTTGYIKFTESHIDYWNTQGIAIRITDGVLSNLNGPAIEVSADFVDNQQDLNQLVLAYTRNGTDCSIPIGKGDNTAARVWAQAGVITRAYAPAICNHNGGLQFYIKDGVFHNTAGPAFIEPGRDTIWYTNGKCHNLFGPAVISSDSRRFEWWVDNQRHNLTGPAIVDTNTNLIKFYIRGDETSPEVWNKLQGFSKISPV